MDDLISRQAAIDALGKEPMVWMDSDYGIAQKNQWALDRLAIETVPAAQLEIIRCKDCEWFGKAGCAIWIQDESDEPKEDDFCSFAERRTDD